MQQAGAKGSTAVPAVGQPPRQASPATPPLEGNFSNDHVLARWREAGEWWNGESYRQVTRYINAKSVLTEDVQETACIAKGITENAQLPTYSSPEDHKEEWALKVHKVRDEKVKKAFGILTDIEKINVRASKQTSFACLHTLSGYSFGRSTMLAEEIPPLCANLGASAALLADKFSLVGAVEFSRLCKQVGIKPLLGASIELESGGEVVLVAQNHAGWRNLSNLITRCHLDQPRGYPLASMPILRQYSEGLFCLTGGHLGPLNRLLIPRQREQAMVLAQELISLYGKDKVFVQIERSFQPWEISVNQSLMALAEELKLIAVAGGVITHALPEHFCAQDVLTCIDTLCTIDELTGRKPLRHQDQPQVADWPQRGINAERYLRSFGQMERLYADIPAVLANTRLVADMCDSDVLPKRTKLPYLYPDETATLREIAYVGAAQKYTKISSACKRRLDSELETISRLGFAGHFLVAWDMCQWAEERGVIYSGRGSVVDSQVAYCLGFSRIDAFKHRLHFDRFLPSDGTKRPDIDIDFEAARREDIRQYLCGKYGNDNVATVAAVGAYLTRGIIREVGKVMGLPEPLIGFLAKRVHGAVSADALEEALQKRPELRNSNIPKERYRWVFRLAERMMDIPRNMRAHSSGVVISSEPVANTVPVQLSGAENVRIIQWDKRSAKYFFDKFDVLCLRGNDVLRGTQDQIRVYEPKHSVSTQVVEDENTYRAMRAGATIGIPQSASPAMRQAHIRLKTKDLTDASLVQAGIRPGVGGAVKINELIARRRGKPYTFSHPNLEAILGNTYGIIVFQEQVDQLLQAFGGYTPGEAEEMREAIHKRRREEYGKLVREKIVSKIVSQGYAESVANEVYEYVSGFQGYGFAQGHALAFAEISVRCIWYQQNHPAEYFAALLNAQPAGYYGPATIANEARLRGVTLLPPDVCVSERLFTTADLQASTDPKIIVPRSGLRVGLFQVGGLSENTLQAILLHRPYNSFFEFVARVRPEQDELEKLILCGALDSLHNNRRAMLWAIPRARQFADNYQRFYGGDKDNPVLPFVLSEPAMPGSSPSPILEERGPGGEGSFSFPICKNGEGVPQGRMGKENLELPPPTAAPPPPPNAFGHLGEEISEIEDFNEAEKAIEERRILGLDVARHIVAFERKKITAKGGVTGVEVTKMQDGQEAFVVGNPIRLRFPPTSSGKRVVFFDLEDESGLLNTTMFDDTYQKYGHALICNPYVTVVGRAQDRDGHIAFLAERVYPYYPEFGEYSADTENLPLVRSDFLVG